MLIHRQPDDLEVIYAKPSNLQRTEVIRDRARALAAAQHASGWTGKEWEYRKLAPRPRISSVEGNRATRMLKADVASGFWLFRSVFPFPVVS